MSKTHIIDGKTYVEVERKAEAGEKVIYVDEGRIATVLPDGAPRPNGDDETYISTANDVYRQMRVLEPVASEEWPPLTEESIELTANDIRWQPDKVIDLLANLARRVSSLEAQLKDTQGNVERQGVEIAELKHLAENNEEDIRELDERSQVINAIQKHYDGGAR